MDDKMELALHVIELKKVQLINSNNKNFKNYKIEIDELMKEKEKVYQNDEKTINKVLTEYLNDVKE